MSNNPHIKKPFTGEHARRYDQMADKAGWLDPDILFGLAFRHIRSGETLLDVGIGTGLASALFHKAGLRVVGLDRSPEMLALCRQKRIATELIEQDVTNLPYPLDNGAADHAVCSGLLHVFEDLSVIMGEVGRILRKDGCFLFVVVHSDAGEVEEWQMKGREGYPATSLYRHPWVSVSGMAEESGFEVVNTLRYRSNAIGRMEMDFCAYVLRK